MADPGRLLALSAGMVELIDGPIEGVEMMA